MQINVVVGILTGYCRLRKRLTNMRIGDNPRYRKWDFHEETAHQILCECYELVRFRKEYIGDYFLESLDYRDISCKLGYALMAKTDLTGDS